MIIYKLQHDKKTVIVQRYWNYSEFETAILSTQYHAILVTSWMKYLGWEHSECSPYPCFSNVAVLLILNLKFSTKV